MFRITPLPKDYKPYKTFEEALVESNKDKPWLRKVLLPETVKQAPAVEQSINVVNYLSKKCGIKFEARFPEDITKVVKQYEKKLKYVKSNNYSEALKSFLEIFAKYKNNSITDDVMLNLELLAKSRKIFERFNLKRLR